MTDTPAGAPTGAGRRPSLRLAVVVGMALVALLGSVQANRPARAAEPVPSFVRTIGGHGTAGVYAWGMQYNPVTGELLVGDYWNYLIRRYAADGSTAGSFFRPASQRRGQPYSLAVDPRDGSIYVPEISDGSGSGYIAKYDSRGTFLFEFNTGARYDAWITVAQDGTLYVADSHYWNNAGDPPKIRRYTVNDTQRTATQVASWGTFGSGPGQMGIVHGLGTDAAGNVYAADATNRVVHVYSSTGSWIRDFGSPGRGVGQFTGDLRGLTVDRQNGWVYVVDAEASQVEKFSLTGQPLLNWGSEGSGPGQTADGGRQITVDGEGDVWVADYGGYRMLEFSSGGTLRRTLPDPAQPPPPGGLSQVRDVAVDDRSGEVWVADSWNNRFQRYAPDGAPSGTWGMRNSHPPYGMNYPRGIAVDPVRGRTWVANTREHVVRVYDDAQQHLFTVGSVDSSSTGNFRWPMDIEVVGDSVWVADYNSGVVKRLSAETGAELARINRSNNGIAVDPVSGDLFVVSWAADRVYRYTGAGQYLGEFGSSGTGAGQFRNPWDIDVLDGRLYVSDAELHRVQGFSLTGALLTSWGTAGSKPGQLRNPSGLDHDAAGNLYVADAGNGRVSVFDTRATPAPADAAPPTVSLTSPTPDQTVAAQTVQITGTTTDDVRVGSVEVAVRNRDSGQWWNASSASWSAVRSWSTTILVGSTPGSAQWRLPFTGVDYGVRYSAQARATDASGRVLGTGLPTVNFVVAGRAGPPVQDTVAPGTTLTDPTLDEVVPAGAVTISGEASDDTATASVAVAVQDRTTRLWWDATSGTWRSGGRSSAARLAAPGSPLSGWSFTLDPGAAGGSGSYYVTAAATDAAGNVDVTKATTRFSVGP